MTKNGKLTAAKKAKNDEFYTTQADIEAELVYYKEHFYGMTVYCNCDDPEESEFWKFFVKVFESWGLKKLMATYYDSSGKSFLYELESGRSGLVKTLLPCDGDFRSAECIELLKEADIVVTNPPFSLFREYTAQLIEYKKKFLILGTVNAVTYREFFPFLKYNMVWVGVQFNKTMEFIVPDSYALKGNAFVDESGRKHCFVPGMCWYTNLDHCRRHQPLDLHCRYYGNENMYPKYDNYDAIECSRVEDIPCDYPGTIGVPITFLGKHCTDQFNIVWKAFGNTKASSPEAILQTLAYTPHIADRGGLGVVNGKRMYARLFIRRKLLF